MQIIAASHGFRSRGLAKSLTGRCGSHSQRLTDLMLGTRHLGEMQGHGSQLGARMTGSGHQSVQLEGSFCWAEP